MAVFLGNAFSLQMLDTTSAVGVTVAPVTAEEVKTAAWESCIGHMDTAAVVAELLGREVECRRISVALHPGDVLFVAQVVGGRLPEGTTTIPDGMSIKFLKVTL